jgi:hypothetical protein
MSERLAPSSDLRLKFLNIIFNAYALDHRTHKTLTLDEFELVQASLKITIKNDLGLLTEEEKDSLDIIQKSSLKAYRKTDLLGIVEGLHQMVMGKKEIRWQKAKREIFQLKKDVIADRSLKISSSTADIIHPSSFHRQIRKNY